MLGGVLGTLLAAGGGYLFGRGNGPKREAEFDPRQLEATLERVVARLEHSSDSVAAAVDPLVSHGRGALDTILERVLEVGGYAAVVMSDDAGLVLTSVGPAHQAETLAVRAAAFGSTGARVGDRHEAVVEGHADRRWTVHRYFEVDGDRICVSATRHGSTPRLDALDGAVGALARVLGAESLRLVS